MMLRLARKKMVNQMKKILLVLLYCWLVKIRWVILGSKELLANSSECNVLLTVKMLIVLFWGPWYILIIVEYVEVQFMLVSLTIKEERWSC